MPNETTGLWYNKNTKVTATDKACQNMGLPTTSRLVMQQYGFYPLYYDAPAETADMRYFELKASNDIEFDVPTSTYRCTMFWIMKSDDQLRTAKNTQITDNYDNYVKQVFEGYDDYEKSTWPQQRYLAWEHKKGHTLPDVNILQQLADKQRMTLDDMVDKVLLKANSYDTVMSDAIARRNSLQAAVALKSGQDLIDLDVSFNPVLNTSEPTEEVLPVEEPTPFVEGEVTPEANAPEGE